MYWYSWEEPPQPGGSFATHPAHDVFHNVLTVVCLVGLGLHAYTFYLMLKVATKQLNEYRYFMMLCTTWDVCIAFTIGVLLQPKLHVPMFPCLSARGPLSLFGNEGARIGMILIFTFSAALIASQCYSLLYRLTLVLCSMNVKRRFLSKPFTLLCLSVVVAATCVISYMAHLTTARPTDELFDGKGLAMQEDSRTDPKGLATYSQIDHFNNLMRFLGEKEFLTEEDTATMCFNTDSWDTLKVFGAIIGIAAVTELACAISGLSIIFKVRRHIGQSDRMRQMHLQLTRLLLLQMFCPVLCIVGPIVYLMGAIILREKASLVAVYLCYVGISLFPVTNAILTIVFVAPYRRFTFQWTRAVFKTNLINSVELQSSTVSHQSSGLRRRGTISSIALRRVAPVPNTSDNNMFA